MIKNNRDIFYKKNDFIGYFFIFTYIIVFFSIIILFLILDNIFVKILLAIIIGFFQAGFNQGKHEFLHRTAIENKYINNFFWYFFSLPILVNPHLNKSFHLGHHKYLGTDNDPELSFKVRQGYSFKDVLLDKLKHPFILDILIANFKILFSSKFPNYVDNKDKYYIKIDSFIVLSLHIILILFSLYFGYYILIFIWYIILEYIGFNILCIFDISEHRGCDLHDFYNDSRTVKSNIFITYITWFNNYHSVHHTDSLDKSVVFYKRKKYFNEINKFQTKQVEDSYLGFLKKL